MASQVARGVKNPLASAGDSGLIPASGGSPGGGSSNPLQDSCLENPVDIGAWWAAAHGVAESGITEQLTQQHTYMSLYIHLCVYVDIYIYTQTCLHNMHHMYISSGVMLKNPPAMHEMLVFNPWVWKIPCSREWQPAPVFLSGKSHGRGAWRATVLGVAKSQT